ncbi:hypothetical protein [Acinetobacter sp.]|uniref:hypothetical protein n=1 Tax=Acinetobacter sp. TaxID=472 RepID=UPI003D01BC95
MVNNIALIEEGRSKYLKEFARKVAVDYGLTDEKEIDQVVNSVVGRYNTSKPLLVLQKSPKADSMLYRDQVRMAYIDLLAYFIQLKYLEKILIETENYSRTSFNSIKSELAQITKTLHLVDTDQHITETFLTMPGKYFDGTLVTNNQLTLMRDTDRAVGIEKIDINVIPVESTNVYHSVAGNKDKILSSGIGSELWSVSVYCNEIPQMEWGPSIDQTMSAPMHISGIAALLDITLNVPILLNNISADFLSMTKLLRAYYLTPDGTWKLLRKSDNTFLESEVGYGLELHNIKQDVDAKRYRFLLVNEEPMVNGKQVISIPKRSDFMDVIDKLLDGKYKSLSMETDQAFYYQYMLGIYNLKIRNSQYVSSGEFTSEEYKTDRGAISSVAITKVIEEASSIDYFHQFFVDFVVKGLVTHSLPILPYASNSVIESVYASLSRTNAKLLMVRPSFYINMDLQAPLIYVVSGEKLLSPGSYTYDKDSNIIYFATIDGQTDDVRVILSYTTNDENSIAYEILASGVMYSNPPSDTSYGVRYIYPGAQLPTTVSGPVAICEQADIHKAVPIVAQQVIEKVDKKTMVSNVVQLNTTPYVNYTEYDWKSNTWSGGSPVKVEIKLNRTDDFVTAIDRTIWSQRTRQPQLDDYGLTGAIQYFVHKNKLYFNITGESLGFYELKVTYLTKADAFKVRIGMNTTKAVNTGIIKQYEVDINVQ